MLWPIFVTTVLVLAIRLHWNYKNRRIIVMAKQLPGPAAFPIVGNAIKFMVQPQEFLRVIRDLMIKYGDVCRVWLGTDLNIIVSNPDDVKLLLTNNKTTMKGPQYKYMADVLGGGILRGSGTAWRKHRKIATPNYGKRAIGSYTDIINQEVEFLIQEYKDTPKGEEIDLYTNIVLATSYTVCQTLMGLSRNETLGIPHLHTLIDSTPTLYDIVFDRMTKWYLQLSPIFWLTKSYKTQKKAMQQIYEFSTYILKLRMERLKCVEESKKHLLHSEEDSLDNTLLSVIDRFLLSQELDTDELITETFTVFTSSQEATAKITSFLLLMMAYYPKYQEKLYAEIINVIGKKDRPITDEDIKQMPFLEMAFKEVIRLFPIGGMLQRTITGDITISTCTLPAGSSLVIPMYHMHRDPRYWHEPDAFNPERFNPDNLKTPNPQSYIPFSLGAMDCLGRHFATKVVKTIVIRIMQNFKLTTLNKYEDMRIMISISTTTMDGFPCILVPRSY